MIIITGASRNIGKYLFGRYSENNTVFGTYFTSNQDQYSLSQKMVKVDIADFNSVSHFYVQIEPFLSNITLINCAGISYNSYAHKSDPVEWKRVIDTNLTGTFNMIRVLLPIMREQMYGRIINFSSVVAQKGTPGASAYAASKSALWGLSKTLSTENGSKNITINNINLGYVNLGMGIEKVPEFYKELIKEQIPSKTFCEPEEIFKTIEYLRNNPYINGSSIDLNGGLI
jgi:NAD(P)-dependent dehydrogenase (short-subunit alcohol dehydrogenase family)